MRCSACGNEWQPKRRDAKPRLPMGWHRGVGGSPLCKECWNARYILRAITFRVVGPVDEDWPSLRESIKLCWRTSTRLANWAFRECAKVDVIRTPDMDQLPKMPSIYLYGLAGEQGIDKGPDSQSTAGVLRMAEKKYRAQRYDSIWLGKAERRGFRYPTPYPIHNAAWSLSVEDERLVLSVRLGGDRRKLILSGGAGFRRHRKAAEKLIAGLAFAGEAAIYERRGHMSDHRNKTNGRDSGGQKTTNQVMVKLVMWLPREASGGRSGTLFVRTDPDALVVALNAKDERLWIYNGDQIRRWTAEHRRKLNRWSDDTKAENRPPRFQSRREAAVLKFRNRMDSVTHEIAAQIVGYARRRRFALVRFNDTDHSYLGRFPYYQLKDKLIQKCDEAGITFECSGDAEKPTSSRKNAKVKS